MRVKFWQASPIILIYCLLVLFLFPGNTWAFLDFTRSIGPDASSMGRGGTTIAIGEDPSSMEINPALISETENYAVQMNIMPIFPSFEFEYDGTGGARYKSKDKDRILLGAGMSFAHKIKDSPWSWGLSFSAPDAIATDYTIQSKFFGPTNASSELLHFRFGPAGAYQITKELSVGMRFGIDYGSLDLAIPLGAAFIDIGQCDGFGVSGALGLFYKPRTNLSFGLYYESPTAMQDLKSRGGDGYIGLATPGGNMYFSNLDVAVEDQQFPQNFGIGVAYSPIPALRISSDLKYIAWWNDWKELTLKFSGHGADDMKNLGMPTTIKVPINVDNQWTFGLGAEYFFADIYKCSLGYHYNDNGMSDNYLLPYVPAEVEHTLTFGFSVRPVKSVKIALAYMYCIMDDSSASSAHGYDQSLEKQFGMPPGSLQSELNGSETKYNAQGVQISASFYW